MKQFIVLAVVLLAVQSIQGGAIVDEKCTCKDTLNSLTKAELIERICNCILQNKKLNDMIDTITCDINAIIQQNTSTKAENAKLIISIQQEKDAKDRALKDLKEALALNESYKIKIADLKNQITAAQARLDACKKQLLECNAEGDRYRCTIAELNARIKQLQADIEKCRLSKKALENQLADCEANYLACTKELSACETSCNKLRADIEFLKSEIIRYTQLNADCQKALSSLRCDLRTLLELSQGLQSQIQSDLKAASTKATSISTSFEAFIASHQLSCTTPTAPCEA